MRENLADVPADPAARERRPRQVVAGADPLRRRTATGGRHRRHGHGLREALAAAERLDQGVPADVVCHQP
jgi:pyruvate dehydrogenase E1 component